MPKIQKANAERIPIPPGDHILTLAEVKELSQPNTYADKDADTGIYEATGTTTPPIRDQFIWVFQSDQEGPDGEPYEYAIFTGRRYGDDRAKLTTLLQMLLPDTDDDDRAGLDTDALIGLRWKARIQMVKNQAGKLVPRHLYFQPMSAEVPL